MSNVSRFILRCSNLCLNKQPALSCRRALAISSRHFQAPEVIAEIPSPTMDDEPKQYEPKIADLVDKISQLTLREVTDLNELLKSTLGIKDAPVMAAYAAPQAASAESTEEDAQGVVEQSEFNIKLLSFADSSKIKVIKAVKLILPELNLVQAKKLVESLPCTLKEGVSKEESEKIKADMDAAGAQVEII